MVELSLGFSDLLLNEQIHFLKLALSYLVKVAEFVQLLANLDDRSREIRLHWDIFFTTV